MGCANRKDAPGSGLALLARFSGSFSPCTLRLSPVPTGDSFRDSGDSVQLPDPGRSGSETAAWQGLRLGALLPLENANS